MNLLKYLLSIYYISDIAKIKIASTLSNYYIPGLHLECLSWSS